MGIKNFLISDICAIASEVGITTNQSHNRHISCGVLKMYFLDLPQVARNYYAILTATCILLQANRLIFHVHRYIYIYICTYIYIYIYVHIYITYIYIAYSYPSTDQPFLTLQLYLGIGIWLVFTLILFYSYLRHIFYGTIYSWPLWFYFILKNVYIFNKCLSSFYFL